MQVTDEQIQAVFEAIHKTLDVMLNAIDKEAEISVLRGRLLANSLLTELDEARSIIHAKLK